LSGPPPPQQTERDRIGGWPSEAGCLAVAAFDIGLLAGLLLLLPLTMFAVSFCDAADCNPAGRLAGFVGLVVAAGAVFSGVVLGLDRLATRHPVARLLLRAIGALGLVVVGVLVIEAIVDGWSLTGTFVAVWLIVPSIALLRR
jgi:hypothetical protein